ncbi:hypothetical protein [Vibrio aestuarianus]|uniref:Conserved outer membrane protein n=1 Tax=Vibrio aestuarianus TaxID=28171 RepID=A0AAX3U4N1_9VIBR|nr:hypothetical protein [Vibrio aestuarianus]MDE1228132.1 hypothetical protein [Vibrio aestuarianus]MDE1237875.1 hypothetical protein [Vibrio aestuarianus]MDE1256894.1 hypothetical protein [Vibrio aestuarianus]MDE1272439.1 hypothetical protein [Vibrio aestuarianus]MDE1293789.1 hypothetical protein [Vibrio aestuarianus]
MRKTIIAAALLLASGQTLAEVDRNSPTIMSNFNYDYVDARIGVAPLTFGAAISKSIHPNAHIVARIDSEFKSDFDAAAGFGFHAPITNWTDFTGEMLFRIFDSENRSTDTGIELNLGIRQWLGPQLEIGGNGGYVSIGDDDAWIGSFYARFHATELFSIGAEARINDAYGEQLMFTTRFKF